MVTGKVIRFDEFRGYGFVAPSTGGDDVFMHVNDLQFDKLLLSPGTMVEFDVEEGERGLKASHVRMVGRQSTKPAPPPARAPQRLQDDDGMCDVLSAQEYVQEVTEALLGGVTAITGEQIMQIRQRMVQIAHTHGWVES